MTTNKFKRGQKVCHTENNWNGIVIKDFTYKLTGERVIRVKFPYDNTRSSTYEVSPAKLELIPMDTDCRMVTR